MFIGYARTSTLDQVAGLEAQERDLKEVGCERLFTEQVSSVDQHRAALETALDFIREGDVLIVTKLDRLARSVADLVEVTGRIAAKGASLRILDLAIDTSTATGELMLNLIGSIAQFERRIMLERQREGIAKAKAEGKYKGRKPIARAQAAEVLRLTEDGLTGPQIAAKLGISLRSVRRCQKPEAQAA
jgi:DNA invertase Pin-like site-specific DNA recombinase